MKKRTIAALLALLVLLASLALTSCGARQTNTQDTTVQPGSTAEPDKTQQQKEEEPVNENENGHKRTELVEFPATENIDPDNPPPDGLQPVNPPVTE